MIHDPEELIILAAKMDKPREDYLKLKTICERFDRGKNSVLSRIMLSLRGQPEAPKGMEALKMLAYGDGRYEKYLADWKKAEKLKIEAQIEFENLQIRFEAFQSTIAFDREMVKKNMA